MPLSKDRNTPRKDGVLVSAPVVAADIIFGGSLVAVNAAGYLNPGSDTAGLIFHGVADERADNAAGANGDIKCNVRRRGLFLFALGTAITQANVGDNVFLDDDQTVDLAANVDNNIFCGIIAEYVSANLAWIDIEPAIKQADVATHIADALGAHAASAVSLADAGGLTDTVNLETLAAELLVRAAIEIADPGDGGAIPVTRSGQCALTTAGVDDTRTLADPTFAGQKLSVSLDVDAGDAVITAATAINQAGNNTITMADAGDLLELVAVQVGGALVWRVAANDGAALSTVG
jgi:hypothetical protein